ncbi:MAG: amidotransferase [Desulfuromonas sp.]|nr:MAG: amidotransferase [Desulfuromonas sp.]
MRAHYLQHVPFEGYGSIKSWLNETGYELTCTRFFADDPLPDVEEIDFLVIMGGPMGVNDTDDYPWLTREQTFIKEMVATGKPVLGICLGAQLIASALGAPIYPNRCKEIGWLPVQRTTDHDGHFHFPDEELVFHWHGETFDLPEGAMRIASSACCENQAFQIGRSVIGLQFHLETTPESARAIAENCRAELVPGECIQSEEEILAAPPERYACINFLMAEVLNYLHQNRINSI